MGSNTDLPKIACYDSTNCGQIYNCGPATSSYKCNIPNPSGTNPNPNCPENQSQYCYGPDPNYCSGILQVCNSSQGYYCNPQVSNPAVNYFSENIGCNVETDGTCLEFERYEQCQNDCWGLGGSAEVNEVCNKQFTDEASCNAMKYFCKWNGGSCGSVGVNPSTLFNTSSLTSETVGGYTLNCAQSSWSSTTVNSYVPNVRTCCLSGGSLEGKKCVTTPRCQFVNSSCDCGFKDISFENNPSYGGNSNPTNSNPINPVFICEDTSQSITTGNGSYITKGYCTWCKGTQIPDFDYREWLIDNDLLSLGSDIRDSIAWGTSTDCSNRCSNYNSCEIADSESAWNECIWRNSNGGYGVDPSKLAGLSNDQISTELSQGFCLVENCVANANNQAEINECNNMATLQTVCENELADQYSTKNQMNVVGVNGNITPRCTEGTNWTHSCIQSGNVEKAQNFACGWCPNLQNDWPANSCPSTGGNVGGSGGGVGDIWYSPLSNIGITSENGAIVAVIMIIIFGSAIFSGLVIGSVYLAKKYYHPPQSINPHR